MRKYLFRILVFLCLGILIGEIGVRVFDLAVDTPVSFRDDDNLIKYEPNQSGTSVQRCKWIINKYGNYGPEPESLDRLITVIGNSYISNTMNPPECHQAVYLSRENQDFNFYPMSRDGASFLEFLEMAKSLESLNPVLQMFYVHDEDFLYSIMELSNAPLTVQYSLEREEIRNAQLTESRLKKALYKFKFAYFLYRNYFVLAELDLLNQQEDILQEERPVDYESLGLLFDFVIENYRVDNILLVFFPGSDQRLMEMTRALGFQILLLEAEDYNSWLTSANGHWSCNGHEEVARQVDHYLSQHMYN